jgi:ribosome-binding protein aMBF1 (putative translation factor)
LLMPAAACLIDHRQSRLTFKQGSTVMSRKKTKSGPRAADWTPTDDLTKMAPAQAIKARREQLALSQGELAQKLGYTNANFISMLEVGWSKVPPANVGLLARILGLPEVWLMERVLAGRIEQDGPATTPSGSGRTARCAPPTRPTWSRPRGCSAGSREGATAATDPFEPVRQPFDELLALLGEVAVQTSSPASLTKPRKANQVYRCLDVAGRAVSGTRAVGPPLISRPASRLRVCAGRLPRWHD